MPILKKKVRKLEDQKEYESHCLWKDVTFNVKIRDIDAASEAKHRLEEKTKSRSLRKEGKGNSMGDKVVLWRWRMLGFLMNHYWNVSVLPSIRLGNTKFVPGSRAGGIIKQRSSFGRTYSLPYCSGSYLRDTGLSEADEQSKQAKLPFFLSVAVTMLILVLRKTSRIEKKMSVPFQIPWYKSQSWTPHSSTAVEIYNICLLVQIILGSIYVCIHIHIHMYIYICTYTYMYIYIYVYIYTHIYSWCQNFHKYSIYCKYQFLWVVFKNLA